MGSRSKKWGLKKDSDKEFARHLMYVMDHLEGNKYDALLALAMHCLYDRFENWESVADYWGMTPRRVRSFQIRFGKVKLETRAEEKALGLNAAPMEVLERQINEMGKAFSEAVEGLDGVGHFLELCRERCKNAVSLRNAGNCNGGGEEEEETEDSGEKCFFSRLYAADAMQLVKKIAGRMREFMDGRGIE